MNLRVGHGVDVHRLEKSLPLFLGGIKIPSDFGALGHSDADVLIHAICDALLGASSLGDIGFHFSDKDPKYKGIDSKILLTDVVSLIKQQDYHVVNVDSTIILESPKLSPYIDAMRKSVSTLLQIDVDAVSIKATTHEKVDSFGESKAIKAYATCLLNK